MKPLFIGEKRPSLAALPESEKHHGVFARILLQNKNSYFHNKLNIS